MGKECREKNEQREEGFMRGENRRNGLDKDIRCNELQGTIQLLDWLPYPEM